MEKSRLMVLIPDRLSDIVTKGEVTERYYNPGNLFEEVHIVMMKDDDPPPEAVRKTAGDARVFVHNIPEIPNMFFRTLGWRLFLLRPWAQAAVELARKIRPAFIRCHGNLLNAYAASLIKKELGIPYIVSMHSNLDTDMRGTETRLRSHISNRLRMTVERVGLRNADLVLPVYADILPYTTRMGVKNAEVAYNVVNTSGLVKKESYALHDPVRVISVGRQFKEKNPENLIRAAARLNRVQLTLVGNGPYHDFLESVARDSGAADRIVFRTSVPNHELCGSFADYDIFATHSDFWGIPKAVMEPLLVGLPVLMNHCAVAPVTEFQTGIVSLVDNTVDGYENGLRKLIDDDTFREQLGRKAFAHAQANWSPEITENKYADIYRRFLYQAETRS